jgi:hypothetical protein
MFGAIFADKIDESLEAYLIGAEDGGHGEAAPYPDVASGGFQFHGSNSSILFAG